MTFATTIYKIKYPNPRRTVFYEHLESNAAFKCSRKYLNHDMTSKLLTAAVFCKRLMGNEVLSYSVKEKYS